MFGIGIAEIVIFVVVGLFVLLVLALTRRKK